MVSELIDSLQANILIRPPIVEIYAPIVQNVCYSEKKIEELIWKIIIS